MCSSDLACERVGLIIAGYEVPHTHLHVIPTTHMGQLNFASATPETPDQLRSAADAIISHLD